MRSELIRIIYPHRCAGCGRPIANSEIICDNCSRAFKVVEPPYCLKCGKHITDERQIICTQCELRGHVYDYGAAAFEYDDNMRASIMNFKFHGWQENAFAYGKLMAELLKDRILSFSPQVLLPVPVHRKRLAERGFNQSELLARELAERLDIPCVSDFLKRNKNTSFQKKLDAKERAENVKGAFFCDTFGESADFMRSRKKRVMLVDDIYTTGSTVNSCALALKAAGTQLVGVTVLSIGVRDGLD